MNPYNELNEKAFWRTACANKSAFDIKEIWEPRFKVTPFSKVVTYGSCFAQHLGKALKSNGYTWLITEESPYGLSSSQKSNFGYDVFSSRTGNIYTTSLLKQWVSWCVEKESPPAEIWRKNGRFYDPFRPNIEVNGFLSEGEVYKLREHAISCFKNSVVNADYFVFTLGLTESWFNKNLSYEYPMCPGTVAGTYNENQHGFVNQGYSDVLQNLMSAIRMMRSLNTNLRFILTVSPVPLTATNSGSHVLVATMRSKSILRAVAEEATTRKQYIDYFPSYELINSPVFRGMFFEPNLRSVNPVGVNLVMENFFNGLHSKFGKPNFDERDSHSLLQVDNGVVCEEQILDAFSR